MLTRIILGITGYKQSGKDTACHLIAQHFVGWELIHLHFAAQGKKEIADILKVPVDYLEANKNHPLVRHLFQWYLNDYCKPLRGDNVWVEALAAKVLELPKPEKKSQLVVITDVRFSHEASWIKQQNGYLIKVERNESNNDPHPSETEVDKIRDIDIHLPNKGTLLSLRRECLWISQYIKERYKV